MRKTCVVGLSADKKFSKPEFSRMMQLSGTFCDFLGPAGIDLDESINAIGKSLSHPGITLTNNKIKDIIKVMRSSKNIGTLLKGELLKRKIYQFFYIIKNNCFTIHKKCT